jgi:UDP-N-acetyl-D-mannosaminuronic acid dehydrogenase
VSEVTAVIGLGYIGLPTAAVLAASGSRVVGVDTDPAVVASVNLGTPHIVEPGLASLLESVRASGLLTATTEVPDASVFIIAVPTPFLETRQADLSYVMAAGTAIAPRLRGGELVILESTCPPGATEQLAASVARARPDLPEGAVLFAHCPERVLPGRVLEELRSNDRIIGGLTPEASARAAQVYRTFCSGQLLTSNARTAELAKLAENAFRDVNIAFANELSMICQRLDIDVWRLIELANHHPRVDILSPGPGVGGHCIAVDPWFIVSAAPEEARLIATARDVNDQKPHAVVAHVLDLIARHGTPRIAVLGLTFKKNIDDLRESPAVQIVGDLARATPGTELTVVDPYVEVLPPGLALEPNVELASLNAAMEKAELIVLLVDHDDFASIDPSSLSGKLVYDTRGVWREYAAAYPLES